MRSSKEEMILRGLNRSLHNSPAESISMELAEERLLAKMMQHSAQEPFKLSARKGLRG